MSINYTVQAEVIDIRTDTPKAEDAFLVDSNVWYWMTYTRASLSAKPYQINDYPKYLGKIKTIKAQLYQCGLSLSELAHSIEKTEFEIFARATGFDKRKKKEFRHNHNIERSNVVAEIQAAWGLVKTMAAPIDVMVDGPTTDAALCRIGSQPLDGYDLFFLEAIAKTGVVQVITDDGDFTIVPRIQVFTANSNVIEAARTQGKLIKR